MDENILDIGLHHWDMEDIKDKIRGKGLYEIGEVYKETTDKLTDTCVEYIKAHGDRKAELVEECNKLQREQMVIALRVMDDIIMSKIK